MNEQDGNVHIDHQGIIQQITDKIITDVLVALAPDEKSRKIISVILTTHRKYGIDALTSMKIIQEIAELTKKLEE
jgi:hypothetical protein